MKRKYNWEGLFEQEEVVRIAHGIDYHCSQSTMVGQIRNEASKRGKRVRVIDEGRSITVEVIHARQTVSTV